MCTLTPCRMRWILQKKSKGLEIVEDKYVAVNKTIRFRVDQKPENVVMVPSGERLEFVYDSGYAIIKLPEIEGHTMIEIS